MTNASAPINVSLWDRQPAPYPLPFGPMTDTRRSILLGIDKVARQLAIADAQAGGHYPAAYRQALRNRGINRPDRWIPIIAKLYPSTERN